MVWRYTCLMRKGFNFHSKLASLPSYNGVDGFGLILPPFDHSHPVQSAREQQTADASYCGVVLFIMDVCNFFFTGLLFCWGLMQRVF